MMRCGRCEAHAKAPGNPTAKLPGELFDAGDDRVRAI